jgi:putative GTP pyrophosphokinase
LLTKSQVDRLGERLKHEVTDDDLKLLNGYRNEFAEAYEEVVQTIRRVVRIEPSGRAAKSIPSIIAKLKRESVRLSQIQDIAGARIVVANILEQDRFADLVVSGFQQTHVVDRRLNPSHGYRAVHVIVRAADRHVEVQIRTSLQHQWAELSEACSDYFPELKYGGGDPEAYRRLLQISKVTAVFERAEKVLTQVNIKPEGVLGVRTELEEAQRLVVDLMGMFREWARQRGQS